VSDTDEEKNGGLLSAAGEADLLSLGSGIQLVAGKGEFNSNVPHGQIDYQSNNLMAQIRS